MNSSQQEQIEQELPPLENVSDFTFNRLRPHEYGSEQILQIPDWSLFWTNITLYLGAVVAIIYALVESGTYLEHDTMVGSVVTDVEGTAYAEFDKEVDKGIMVFDQYDLRKPEQEKGAVFLATRIIGYKQQLQAQPGNEALKCLDLESKCKCDEGELVNGGRATGKCEEGYCEIEGWCPKTPQAKGGNIYNLQVDYDAHIKGVEFMNLTFQISAKFPNYNWTRTVTAERKIFGYNFWRVGDIIEGMGVSYKDLADSGAIIVMNMDWECDYLTTEPCNVQWDIFRADEDQTTEGGMYLWDTNYSPARLVDSQVKVYILESRTLNKIYGLRILFNISGRMRRFSWLALASNIGSMLGLMAIVPFVLNFVLRRRHKTFAQMTDTDMDERDKMQYTLIKRLLLEYLKGQQDEEDKGF